ncbi:MAG: hypothetical protein N2484_00990 [Clostridia bacterium]|nr:hypothetical protein [Clostridia bacterium]
MINPKKFLVISAVVISIFSCSAVAFAYTTQINKPLSPNVHNLSTGVSEIDEGSFIKLTSKEQQVADLLDLYSWANRENYIHLPKPPVGDWRPGNNKVFLTAKEIEQIPLKGVPYGETTYTDEKGRVFTLVPVEPPKELIEWAGKYNAKIPGWNAPSGKIFDHPVDSIEKSGFWKEASIKISNNIKEYEKWFYNK